MTADSHHDSAKGPIAWMAGHSVAANLVMFMCLVGGFIALRNIKQEVFPEITRDTVSVSVSYPGASPEEVESGIILAVEEVVRGVDDVGEISSVASEGSARIDAEVMLGADEQKVAQDIQREVGRLRTLPEDAEEPVVSVGSHRREVLSIVIFGDVSTTVLHSLGELGRDLLLQEPDVTQVELTGLPPLEISIEVSEENLRRYGLTLSGIARHLGDAALDVFRIAVEGARVDIAEDQFGTSAEYRQG